MLAADANIEVARARLMPSIDLASQPSACGNFHRGTLATPESCWSTAASLVAAIFDGVRERMLRAFAQSYYDGWITRTARRYFQAVREVECANRVRTGNTSIRSAGHGFAIRTADTEVGW